MTVSGTFYGYRLEDQEDPTSICGTVLHVKDGMQHLDYVYVDSIKGDSESEDERIRKAIESIIRVYGKTQGEWIAGYDMDTLVVHLRGAFACLEKQKEQKSVEWSEEDETVIDCAVDVVEKAGLPSLAASLKSLRPQPHWKPSEVQMVALARATNRCVGVDDAKILIKLLEQLESL